MFFLFPFNTQEHINLKAVKKLLIILLVFQNFTVIIIYIMVQENKQIYLITVTQWSFCSGPHFFFVLSQSKINYNITIGEQSGG